MFLIIISYLTNFFSPHSLSHNLFIISIVLLSFFYYLSQNFRNNLKKIPKKSHPSEVTRTAFIVIGLEEKKTKNNSTKSKLRKAIRIFAKTPTALAAFYRLRKGKKIIPPKKNFGFSENFFHMCFGKVPNKEIVKAFDVSLILYAEHSFNVSTFTARTITSSL